MSRQSIQKIKAMLLCIEYDTFFVDTVDTYTGVCGSYTTPYAGVKTLHKVASRPLSNFKGDCRQDAQPIPNS